jgi:hypothetical protein
MGGFACGTVRRIENKTLAIIALRQMAEVDQLVSYATGIIPVEPEPLS